MTVDVQSHLLRSALVRCRKSVAVWRCLAELNTKQEADSNRDLNEGKPHRHFLCFDGKQDDRGTR